MIRVNNIPLQEYLEKQKDPEVKQMMQETVKNQAYRKPAVKYPEKTEKDGPVQITRPWETMTNIQKMLWALKHHTGCSRKNAHGVRYLRQKAGLSQKQALPAMSEIWKTLARQENINPLFYRYKQNPAAKFSYYKNPKVDQLTMDDLYDLFLAEKRKIKPEPSRPAPHPAPDKDSGLEPATEEIPTDRQQQEVDLKINFIITFTVNFETA